MIPIRAVEASRLERMGRGELQELIEMRLEGDSTWSPRWRASVTVEDTPIQWPSFTWEKVQLGWFVIRIATLYGPKFRLADITVEHGGSLASLTADFGGDLSKISAHYSQSWNHFESILPLSKWTEMWGGDLSRVTAEVGGNLAEITKRMRQPGGAWHAGPPETTIARLQTRRIDNNGDGTLTYELASDDVRMHTRRLTQETPLTFEQTTLRSLVEALLSQLGGNDGTPMLETGQDLNIPPGLVWNPGETLWDAIAPTLEAVGWELFADLDGRWYLQPRETITESFTLNPDVNLIEYQPSTEYAQAAANAAMIEYPDSVWPDPDDKWDIYVMPGGGSHVIHETRPGNKPPAGAAQRLLERTRARARIATARSTIAHHLKPGMRIALALGSGNTFATIRSLAHEYQAAETSYQLTDIRTS